MIRFLCHVGPGRDAEREALRALVEDGHRVRVVPVNFADYTAGMREWSEFSEQLTEVEVGEGPFVNVVCSAKDSDFADYLTVGVPNLAVVLGEVEAFKVLREYDFAATTDVATARSMIDEGVRAAVLAARFFPLGMIAGELWELAQKQKEKR